MTMVKVPPSIGRLGFLEFDYYHKGWTAGVQNEGSAVPKLSVIRTPEMEKGRRHESRGFAWSVWKGFQDRGE